MITTNSTVAADVNKLRHVPIYAVCTLLRDLLGEEISLKGKTRDYLISLAANSPQVTKEHIAQLYEDFRYGGRACFYLYLLTGDYQSDLNFNEDAWNEQLSEIQNDQSNTEQKIAICDFEILDEGITEVRYSYESVYSYIEPNTESSMTVKELNFGFLWINLDSSYMVVMSKLEKVNGILEELVRKLTSTQPEPVRLTKGIVGNFFNLEDISRASWVDGKNGLRRSIAGDHLLTLVGTEVKDNDKSLERTTGLYRETLKIGMISKLGMHLQKGKIYLTRNIATSDLRKWMYSRLHPFILSLKSQPSSISVVLSSAPITFLNVSTNAQGIFRDIISAILTKRLQPDLVVSLKSTSIDLFVGLKEYFLEPEIFLWCSECNEFSRACCAKCHGERFIVLKNSIKCQNCGFTISGDDTEMLCEEGHSVSVSAKNLHFVIRPNHKMQTAVAKFINTSVKGEVYNADEEFFWIDSSELKYGVDSKNQTLDPAEVLECGALVDRDKIPQALWDKVSNLVLSTKEKCGVNNHHPRSEVCDECYFGNPGRLCLPKIFRALSKAFKPTPHGAAEFGDVQLSIKIKNKDLTFIGIVKSANQKNPQLPLTHTDKTADEIIRQIIRQAIRDNAVDIFGIITPQPLDLDLQASIKLLAKMAHKPVVLFGHEELIRMCCSLMLDPSHHLLNALLH